MLIDFIIPCLNSATNAVYCVDSIDYNAGHCDVSINRIIFVNDGSTDWTMNYINGKRFQYLSPKMHRLYKTVIEHEKPLGFSKCVNEGLAMSNAEFVCIMHNDIQFKTKDFLYVLQSRLEGLANDEILVPYIDGSTLIEEQKIGEFMNEESFPIDTSSPICWIARKSLFDTRKFDEILEMSSTAGIEFTKRNKDIDFYLVPILVWHEGNKGIMHRAPGFPEAEIAKLEEKLK